MPPSSPPPDHGRRQNRLARLLPAAVALTLALLFLWPLWWGAPADRMHIGGSESDFLRQFHPYRAFVARAWAGFHLPLWNPHQLAGGPALADPQLAVLYPLRLPQALISLWWDPLPVWAVELEAALHLALGGLATAFLLRRLGGAWPGAALAGAAFGLGGYLTGYPLQQLAVLDTAAWIPVLLWALSGWMAPGAGRREGRILMLAGLMMALAGHPQTALFGCWAGLAWAIALARRGGLGAGDTSRRIALWAAGTAGLSAVQWLPAAAFLAKSARALSEAEIAAGLPPVDAIQVLAPHVISQWSPLYVGALALPLAIVAWRRARPARFWLGLAAGGWLLALGGHNPLFPLLRLLPGLTLFRHQERAAILWSLGLAVAAGLGLNALLAGGRPAFRQAARVVMAAAAVLGLGALLLAAAFYGRPVAELASACATVKDAADAASVPSWATLATPLAQALAFSALILGLAWAALAAAASGRLAPQAAAWLLAALMAFDLASVNRGRALCPAEAANPRADPLLAALLHHAKDGRVSSEALLPGGANAASLWGLYDSTGDSPLRLAALEDLVRRAPEIVWWRILGVRYVATLRPPGDAPLTPMASRGEATLYEVGLPSAPVWVPALVRCPPPAAGAVAGQGDPGPSGSAGPGELTGAPWLAADYDPVRQLDFAPGDSRAAAACQDGAAPLAGATAQLTGLDPGRARMTAHMPAGGWLVWSQAYDRGWRVRATATDGRRLDLLPVAAWGAVMALPLPEGQWALRWTYWPDAVNWGAVISLLTAVMVFGRRPRAKEKPVSDFSAAPQSSA